MSGLVGVVLVSHSHEVASSTAALALGLTGGGTVAPVAAAGGTDDGAFGTSSDSIMSAMHSANRGLGLVVLADLGSAVLTVKALLAEAEGVPERARLADAPFVEGAVAAVVTASAGASLEEVVAAAHEAYDYRKV